MCLILFAIDPANQYRLIVASNRDEYYDRPSRRAIFWPEDDNILAGKDLSMGGTWMGITRSGRFAAVTNFRETPPHPVPPCSRGELTTGFLTSTVSPTQYLTQMESRADQFRGFNLVLGDDSGFYYYSNRTPGIRKLSPGYYGLSNQLLNCEWPKVSEGRQRLQAVVTEADVADALFSVLSDTGDGRAFSNSFITSAEYGTCAKTVLVWHNNGDVLFEEQGFLKSGQPDSTQRYNFRIESR